MSNLLITISFVMVTLSGISQDLKVITFNIRYDNPDDKENAWDNRKKDMISFLENERADIMGFQEVLYNQLDYLNENLADYDYVGVGREDGKQKGEFSPIFYRKEKFELENFFTLWLSETPDVPGKGWDAALERIATFALLRSKGNKQQILVVNTHYDHRGEKARYESSKLILNKIEQRKESRVIIMGDLNSEPGAPSVMTITEKGYLDAFTCKDSSSPSVTFAGFENFNYDSGERIDYVFLKGLQCMNYSIGTPLTKSGNLSDHLPVVVEVK